MKPNLKFINQIRADRGNLIRNLIDRKIMYPISKRLDEIIDMSPRTDVASKIYCEIKEINDFIKNRICEACVKTINENKDE